MADIAKKQNNAKKPVGITETILRDAHQSLIADASDRRKNGSGWISFRRMLGRCNV